MARKKTPTPVYLVENAVPALRKAIRAVALAVGNDTVPLWKTLIEVQWNTPMGIMVTATDSHRLHTATVQIVDGCSVQTSAAPAVAHYTPKSLLGLFGRGESRLSVDSQGTVTVETDGATVSASRVFSEGLPPWNQIIPTYRDATSLVVGVSPKYLGDAAEGAALVLGSVMGCKFTKGRDLDPITVSAERDGNIFLAIVMPMRVSEHDEGRTPATLERIRENWGKVVAPPVAAE
jgi:hypothetical protein